MKSAIANVAVVGNYIPRKCGIATFTTDLSEAIAREFANASVVALPMTDTEEGYDYPERVHYEIRDEDLQAYRNAAEYLNLHKFDAISLQHEYGIYGGPDGSHILTLMREVDAPVVTTLHTVLREPTEGQLRVMKEVVQLSDRLVVMNSRCTADLTDIYGARRESIDFIHHGIPDVPFVDPNFFKDNFKVEGKTVLLTFGLLSPGKGIEYALQAMPAILAENPEVVYIVLGATHPNLLKTEGETYRRSLEDLTRELGVAENVIFANRFVSLEELIEYICATDVYISTPLGEGQIVSGTLAYTVGAGKAVVATPYSYARDLLSGGCGELVPFRDSAAISGSVNDLLSHDTKRHALRKRAYTLGRDMIWPEVARRYMASFERARTEGMHVPRVALRTKRIPLSPEETPALKLDHLQRMTDDTGLLQHAVFGVPNYREGYCTDDNARAMVLTMMTDDLEDHASGLARRLEARYLSFLHSAFDESSGRFRNFMSHSREWLETTGSEDSHGRALWALGTAANRSRQHGTRDLASRIFAPALIQTQEFVSPRAWAFSILGVHEYLGRFKGHRAVRRIGEALAEHLLDHYRRNSGKDWLWFEDILTYSNAKLPHALLRAGAQLKRHDMLDAGLTSLEWLTSVQRIEGGHFVAIGSKGFYPRGGARARFDQQPVEAHATVSACMEAHRITREPKWKVEAQRAFDWFLGRNDLGIALYDPATGGCFDGLESAGVNRNQGAESLLAFLLSLVEMRKAMKQSALVEPRRDETPRVELRTQSAPKTSGAGKSGTIVFPK